MAVAEAPIRALHITPTYWPATRYGGPIGSVHGLCAALAKRGVDVHVFTTNVDGPGVSDVPLKRPVAREGVHITYFPTGLCRRLYRSPAMAIALREQIADFDIIHLHSAFLWPTAAGAAAARRFERPYVMSPRGMLVGDLIRRRSRLLKSAWILMVEHRNLSGAAATHFTADIEADEARKLRLPVRRVAIIPNGVDMPSALAPVSTLAAETRPTILCLGRISWKKGLDRVIPALIHVPEARLIVAGNDDEGYLPTLRSLARLHKVEDRVEFIGTVQGERKWRLIAGADIFVLASYSENFGNVALEAMACGVPVVVTAEVGLASAIASIGAGVVSPGDPTLLGGAMARLLNDADARQRMGAAGRKAAQEQFGWDRAAASVQELYEELSQKAARRASGRKEL